jgi:flagellar basal body-associated protein FliL
MKKRDKDKIGTKKKRTKNVLMFSVAVTSILALVFITVLLSGKKETAQAEAEGTNLVPENAAELLQKELSETLFSQSRHIKGDLSAPVAIIEFSDFQ